MTENERGCFSIIIVGVSINIAHKNVCNIGMRGDRPVSTKALFHNRHVICIFHFTIYILVNMIRIAVAVGVNIKIAHKYVLNIGVRGDQPVSTKAQFHDRNMICAFNITILYHSNLN